jgi:hypothetical protein
MSPSCRCPGPSRVRRRRSIRTACISATSRCSLAPCVASAMRCWGAWWQAPAAAGGHRRPRRHACSAGGGQRHGA